MGGAAGQRGFGGFGAQRHAQPEERAVRVRVGVLVGGVVVVVVEAEAELQAGAEGLAVHGRRRTVALEVGRVFVRGAVGRQPADEDAFGVFDRVVRPELDDARRAVGRGIVVLGVKHLRLEGRARVQELEERVEVRGVWDDEAVCVAVWARRLRRRRERQRLHSCG